VADSTALRAALNALKSQLADVESELGASAAAATAADAAEAALRAQLCDAEVWWCKFGFRVRV